MTNQHITHQRLLNQQIINPTFDQPKALVQWMACIQAQDFAGAKWAIGNRIEQITEAQIDQDFNDGKILRTHVLRPTWHFVAPEDIRWMLKLSASKVKALSKGQQRKLDIDDKVLTRSKTIFTKALQHNQHLTRDELKLHLKKGKINTDDIRLALLLMDAELDGIICSGPRKKKQFTYALLEERAPKAKTLNREDSIAEIGTRYFTSRGPATLQDFVWWSNLTVVEAKQSIEMNRQTLTSEIIKDDTYWFGNIKSIKHKPKQTVNLLPSFDEYAVAYKNRNHILDADFAEQTGNGIFKPTIIINGKIAGIWKRLEIKNSVKIETTPFGSWNKTTTSKVRAVAEEYAKFLNKPILI